MPRLPWILDSQRRHLQHLPDGAELMTPGNDILVRQFRAIHSDLCLCEAQGHRPPCQLLELIHQSGGGHGPGRQGIAGA